MRYLFINSSLTNGGSEKVMVLLANYFADSGLDTHMLILREEENKTYSVSKNLSCRFLHYGKHGKAAKAIQRFICTRDHIRSLQPDVVISFMWDINILTCLAAICLPPKVIVSERAHPRMGYKNRIEFIMNLVGERWIFRRASRVVLQTTQVLQYYTERMQKKCVVIPNPISGDIPDKWIGERDKRIVAVGRFSRQKNFSLLLRAFAKFHQEHEDYKLTIYGDGQLRNELENLIQELGIENFVDMPGYVNDVDERMVSASMYISSSNYEGISNAMLEALAMGIPTICTDCPVGGTAMCIENYKNGILIPVGDENALVDAMGKIADDGKFAETISLNAVQIKGKYSIRFIADRWLKLCEECCI